MNEHLTSIGPALANHLWQTTAFVAAVWLTTLALRKNQARVRYALWLAASLKFLLPFSLLIALGGMLPRPHQAVAAPAIYATVDEVAQPFSQSYSTPIPAAPAPTLMERVEARVPMTLAAIWLCGGVLLLALWGARWIQIWRTLRRASRAVSGREFDLLRTVERAGGLTHADSSHGWGQPKRPIPLLLSSELMEPGIFGMGIGAFRPVLIWPERLSTHLDDEHIEAILIHELAHSRRRDNLTAALHMLVTALFWFHPLVWWMERRMIEERERACDEAVVATGSRPGIYAESLLKACRFCIESPLTCVAGITGADLRDRIVQIMTARAYGRLTLGKKLLLAAAGLTAIAVPMLLGQALAGSPVEEPTTTFGYGKPSLKFDVVSVKQDKSNDRTWISSPPDGDGMTVTNMSPRMMISIAYNFPLHDMIDGLPGWADSERYEVSAKVAESDVSQFQKFGPEERNPMLQPVLEDQFRLKFHYATRKLPVYELVRAKGGPKLAEIKSHFAPNGRKDAGGIMVARGSMRGEGIPMAIVARVLSQQIGRPVIDKTGLKGNYSFALKWTPDEVAAPAPSGSQTDPTATSIFTAVQEQIGLKLQPAKDPIRILVVDHIEKPTVDSVEVPPPNKIPTQKPAPARVATQLPAAMSPLAFEVATVKPMDQSKHPGALSYTDAYPGLKMGGSVYVFIEQAYGLHEEQILGGPAWAKSAGFDILAKPSAPADPGQINAMLRTLLKDRFQLAVHTETRDGDEYSLIVVKRGSKMKQADESDPRGASWGPTMLRGTMGAAEIANRLSSILGHPVLDHSGLSGIYTVDLKWAPDERMDGPSVFTAIQEQLGLKLEPVRGPIPVLVIDHIERPSAN